MLNQLTTIPADPLLSLMAQFRSDPRQDKIDLGVGIFKTEMGNTPVMRAVKGAERIIVETQESKAYVGLAGDTDFVAALQELTLGASKVSANRIIGIQTPGSSAALRLAGDLIKRTNSDARLWIGKPCWANHIPIFESAGLKLEFYDHYSFEEMAIDHTSIFAALQTAEAGDFVLLQGCCHNPTGADYNRADWLALADLCIEKSLTPVIDIAYQGLGKGLDEDMENLRLMIERVPNAILTVSCSKNFGLYRDRVGAIYVLSETEAQSHAVRTNLFNIARTSYSMPPDHGAAIVKTILRDPALRFFWEEELNAMRTRILDIRSLLSAAWDHTLLDLTGLTTDQGMFSILPLSSAQIDALRTDHGIYMAGNGRINLAGLKRADISRFTHSLKTVL